MSGKKLEYRLSGELFYLRRAWHQILPKFVSALFVLEKLLTVTLIFFFEEGLKESTASGCTISRRTQPRPFSTMKVPQRQHQSIPREEKQFCTNSNGNSASAPNIWNPAFAFSLFPIFAVAISTSMPLLCHAYGFTALPFGFYLTKSLQSSCTHYFRGKFTHQCLMGNGIKRFFKNQGIQHQQLLVSWCFEPL